MSRTFRIAAGQLGPIHRNDAREAVVARLVALLREAAEKGCELVVFPEMALTTFFPRWLIEDENELDSYYEAAMPSKHTLPLFEAAAALRIGFYLGYAELDFESGRKRRFNSAVLVDRQGRVVGKYRKIHLPGHSEYRPLDAFQHLEKRYFEVGDQGFGVWDAFGGKVGMCLCNDRRWPETYRVMALKGAELVLLGYNTPLENPAAPQPVELRRFHNRLVMQAGAYQNACWVVGAAKAGLEEGVEMMAGSVIVSPHGEIRAEAQTSGDEIVHALCDLDETLVGKRNEFNFAAHRRPEHYGLITDTAGQKERAE